MGFKVQRTRPDPRVVDGNAVSDQRYSGYGEQIVLPLSEKLYVLGEEGSYFVATNPTPGTGVTGHAAPTTLDNTKPFIFIRNANENGGRRLMLDYIKLVVTAAGTTGTLNYATHLLDRDAAYTSGGSAITPASPNLDLTPTSGAQIYAGAVVATAGANQRIIAHQAIRPVIPVVGDTMVFNFGSQIPAFVGMAIEGTLIMERCIAVPPVVLGPAQWYKLVLWRAAQTVGAAYEFEIGYWER